MKLAHVKFIKGTNVYLPGEYAFRIKTNSLTVEVGDILKDTRYSDCMKVIKISEVKSSMYYNGFVLKTLTEPYTREESAEKAYNILKEDFERL